MTDENTAEVTLRDGAPKSARHDLLARTYVTRDDDGAVTGQQEEITHLTGRRLSHASSRQQAHRHAGEFAPPGWKCGACRWFEVTIYALPAAESERQDDGPPEARYVVHTLGRSVVPTEINFARVAWADTPFKVLELLTQWSGGRGRASAGDMPKIPEASAEAVEAAAHWDPALDAAYDQWVAAGVR